MISLLFSLIPSAIAVMLSPTTLVMMLLFSLHGTMKDRGSALLFSRMIITALIMIAMLYFGRYVGTQTEGTNTRLDLWFHVIIGIFFIIMGFVSWLRRPKNGEEATIPKFLRQLMHLNPWLVIGLNDLTMIFSLKNLALMASADSAIAHYTTRPLAQFFWICLYAFISCIILFAIWLITLFGKSNARAVIERLRDWLTQYMYTMTAILLVFIGSIELLKTYQTYY